MSATSNALLAHIADMDRADPLRELMFDAAFEIDQATNARAALWQALTAADARVAELTALLRRCVDDPETGGLYQLGLDAAYAVTEDKGEAEHAAIEAAGAIMQAVAVALGRAQTTQPAMPDGEEEA